MKRHEWLSLRLVRLLSLRVEGLVFGWGYIFFVISISAQRDQVRGHEWVSLRLGRLLSFRVKGMIFGWG